MRAVIMKYVDNIGAMHGIAPTADGWQIVEKIHGITSPIYARKAEAMMWLDSYANTFGWKEAKTFDV